MSRIIRLLFILLVLFAGIAFHLRNDDPVMLDFYSGSAELPFSVWLLLVLTLGVVLGLLACLPSLVSARVQIGRLRRRVQGLEPPAPGTGKPEGGG